MRSIYSFSVGTLKFIDFEYADSNYQGFDIANHFNEWAGFEADYTRYPNKDQQYQFFQPYLKEFIGKDPTPQELHTLYVQVNKFSLVIACFVYINCHSYLTTTGDFGHLSKESYHNWTSIL